MKILTTLMTVLLCWPLAAQTATPAPATPADQVNQAKSDLKNAQALRLVLVNDSLIQKAVKTGIDENVTAWRKAKTKVEADKADFGIRVDTLNADAVKHNNPPCIVTDQNPHNCDEYHKEFLALQERTRLIVIEDARLAEEKRRVDMLEKKNTDDTLQWFKESKRLDNEIAQQDAAIAKAQTLIAPARKSYLDCLRANKGQSLEYIHEVCGQLFDGNSLHEKFTNKGTGGATPNK
jgi:hypothetical protein